MGRCFNRKLVPTLAQRRMSVRRAFAGGRGLWALAAVMASAVVLPGCASDDDGAGDASTTAAPSGLASPRRLEGSYTLNGYVREVSFTLTPTLVTRDRRSEVATLPPGRALVVVDVRVDDDGPDHFDTELARFTVSDTRGRRHGERLRLPTRRLEPGSRSGARVLAPGFFLPTRERIASLEMRTIVDAFPARARWRIADRGT